MEAEIYIYTDGSSSITTKCGGWAYVAIRDGKTLERSGNKIPTTNNEMELMAVQESLNLFGLINTTSVVIYSDSQYVVKAINYWWPEWEKNNWNNSQGRPVANEQLIRSILIKLKVIRVVREVRLMWIPGHSGIEGNERADDLAGEARVKLQDSLRKK